MILMKLNRLFSPALAASMGAVLALSGCAAFTDESDQAAGGRLDIAVGFYPLQFVAERVAGDLATVENLTTPGQEPHDLELSINQTSALARADVVVFEQGLQPAVDDAVASNAEGVVIDVVDIVDLLPPSTGGDETDPHFWLDPLLLDEVAAALAKELSALDGDNASTYAANAAALHDELVDLDEDYTAGLAECERNVVVVSHDAFGYLSRYGLRFEAIAGLSPDAEPTPADLARLHDLIDTEGLTTIFGERLISSAMVDTLAADTDVQAAVLDPLEGLTEESEGEDYVSVMRYNLEALMTANGCQ